MKNVTATIQVIFEYQVRANYEGDIDEDDIRFELSKDAGDKIIEHIDLDNPKSVEIIGMDISED